MIDEKSMIGQKTLFYIHKRLQEAKPDRDDEPFGGMSIVLLGDWKQLPPVLDSPLYQDPSELQGQTEAAWKKDQEKKTDAKGQQFKAQGHQPYRKFDKSVIFTKVQRQDGEAQAEFRIELDHLGKGTLSMADYQRWQCRSLDALPEEEKNAFYQDGILACALKKEMVALNLKKVCNLK
jgi:ATP-dependent DNA helicase PIF1